MADVPAHAPPLLFRHAAGRRWPLVVWSPRVTARGWPGALVRADGASGCAAQMAARARLPLEQTRSTVLPTRSPQALGRISFNASTMRICQRGAQARAGWVRAARLEAGQRGQGGTQERRATAVH